MNATPKTQRKIKPITLILVFVIFIAPFSFAWYYYITKDQRLLKTMNHGDLVQPVKNIDELAFTDPNTYETFKGGSLQGKWWIFYVGPDKCLEHCHENLYNIKQIITALGRDASRVKSMFVSLPDCQIQACEGYVLDHYPDMKHAQIPSEAYKTFFKGSSVDLERERVGEIFLCDPRGNIMLRYSGEVVHQNILKDLKRLLKTSKIG